MITGQVEFLLHIVDSTDFLLFFVFSFQVLI